MTTNYDRIKNASLNEMIEILCYKVTARLCEYCAFKDNCEGEEHTSCKSYIRKWLQSESEE